MPSHFCTQCYPALSSPTSEPHSSQATGTVGQNLQSRDRCAITKCARLLVHRGFQATPATHFCIVSVLASLWLSQISPLISSSNNSAANTRRKHPIGTALAAVGSKHLPEQCAGCHSNSFRVTMPMESVYSTQGIDGGNLRGLPLGYLRELLACLGHSLYSLPRGEQNVQVVGMGLELCFNGLPNFHVIRTERHFILEHKLCNGFQFLGQSCTELGEVSKLQ